MTKLTINRRRWLQGAAALAAPAIVPFKVFGADAPSEKTTIAFIGVGNNGSNYLGPFLQDDRVRVVAVCDVNKEGPGYWDGSIRGREPARRRVNDFYGGEGCDGYEDFRDVLARKDIDCVYIAVPDHWHAPIAIAAARAKKDIYCQKPLSLTIHEGRRMVEEVTQAGVVWQTGSQQRSDSNFRIVCELVRNGRIGKLHTVRCGLPGGIPDYGKTADQTDPVPVPDGFNYDRWLGPAPEAYYCPARVGVNFRWNYDYSGGQVTDWGGHHPDIAQWGMGTELTGPIAIKKPKAKFAEHPVYNTAVDYHFECVYENGVTLIISNKERGGVTFEGENGTLWANRGQHDADPKSLLDDPIPENGIHLYKSDDHVKNFVDCVFSRQPTVAPIEVAHRSITLAHLGNIAMRTGRELTWDPVKEQIVGDSGANDMLDRPHRAPWTV
ncbi:MAG: gfo/Idh/MocA family oxidoreductase [bacterium]|nr:gfo/Idh/MocA family oxidoreductase [bacterium]